MDGYVTFDEFIDVESSLLALNAALEKLPTNPLLWKSVILNTHAALQGACVCILTGTHGGGALSEASEKAYLIFLNRGSDIAAARAQDQPPPEPMARPDLKLQNLPMMLRRLPIGLCVDVPRDYCEFENCEHQPAKDLYLLHAFRTNFSHFPIVSWSIETRGLPRITATALRHMQLIVESHNYKRRNRFVDTQVAAQLELANQILN